MGKVKNTSTKIVLPKSKKLQDIVVKTMGIIEDIVGATLGPGGCPVMLERSESGLPPMVSKDGVTVIKALGFREPIADGVLELARDASVRTANEAGDGTTTAAVLAAAIVRETFRFCEKNPKISPQYVVRSLMRVFREVIEPALKNKSTKIDLDSDSRTLLWNVAMISANGDSDLADAVMEAVKITGDEGNITIVEQSGPSVYRTNKIDGYPIALGYEDSARKFYSEFINDAAHNRCLLHAPAFILYHGVITNRSVFMEASRVLTEAWMAAQNGEDRGVYSPNFVLVATGFSDAFLGDLATNFAADDTMNIVPLLTPRTPMQQGQKDLLMDLAAITGATIFDPTTRPLDTITPEDVGPGIQVIDEEGHIRPGSIEIFRSKTVVRGRALGEKSEQKHLKRIEDLITQSSNPESKLDAILLKERLAKLTSGIAQLVVSGASNAELKERRDRAEDAVCAVIAAIKHGCLPGACWGLAYVANLLASAQVSLPSDINFCREILVPALGAPHRRILSNIGVSDNEIDVVLSQTMKNASNDIPCVYNAREQEWVDAFKEGLLDATPAVLEALRNAMSIALQLGTLGGAVMYERDEILERQETRADIDHLRSVSEGESMED